MNASILRTMIGKTEKEATAIAAGWGWETWSILPGQAIASAAELGLVILEVDPQTNLVVSANPCDRCQLIED